MSYTAIQTQGLNFSFGKARTLTDLNLSVPTGSIFGFLGPNGAGKTTTIKCLLGLLQYEGHVAFFGNNAIDDRIHNLAQIGAMIEAPSLYDHLNAYRNLEITCKLRGLPVARIPEVLDIVGLQNDARKPTRNYSTGMKQRLSLAIALLPNPRLLILDEPINGLDPGGIIEIRTLLTGLSRDHGCTVFLSSHILSEIEKLCTHVGVIDKGKLLFQGTMQELLNSSGRKLTVRLETDNDEKAHKVLEGSHFVLANKHHLMVTIKDRKDIPSILEKMMKADISVYEVHTETSDLESSFLELINI